MCFNPVTIATHPNSPKYIHDYYGKEHNVPCGRCVECRSKMINDWTFRLTKQYMENSGTFITLTYSDENLIYNIKDKQATLVKEHLQLYWKKLRKAGYKFKYFAVGEYGTKTKRPHYHALLFGVHHLNENFAEIAQAKWQHGNIHFGEISEASIKYTLKYCLKTAFSADEISSTTIAKKIQQFDREPEKATMSKNLGISWLEEAHMYDHIINNAGNAKFRIPRYYIKKIFNDQDRERRFHALLKVQKRDKRTEKEKYLLKKDIIRKKLLYLKKENTINN